MDIAGAEKVEMNVGATKEDAGLPEFAWIEAGTSANVEVPGAELLNTGTPPDAWFTDEDPSLARSAAKAVCTVCAMAAKTSGESEDTEPLAFPETTVELVLDTLDVDNSSLNRD